MKASKTKDTFGYRPLAPQDLSPGLLRQFDRRQEVQEIYKRCGDHYIPEKTAFVMDWNEARKQEVTSALRKTLENGGSVYGAFDGKTLAGFGSVTPQRWGSGEQYVRLACLQVDGAYRRQGIGKHLFALCTAAAQNMGAQKLYITAFPSGQTLAFYRAMGCLYATEIVPTLWAEEPEDVHMEYTLTPTPARSKEQITRLQPDEERWNQTAAWAGSWQWRAGTHLAQRMRDGAYTTGTGAVFIAWNGTEPVGCCTLEEHDGIQLPFSPFISFVYVSPPYRGQRLSQRLCAAAAAYAHKQGFRTVYVVSGEKGLYEKYGFVPFRTTDTAYGATNTVFRKALHKENSDEKEKR